MITFCRWVQHNLYVYIELFCISSSFHCVLKKYLLPFHLYLNTPVSLRWHNHLNPAINKEAWTEEEELDLMRAHQIHGNKWAELTKFLPGRYHTFL